MQTIYHFVHWGQWTKVKSFGSSSSLYPERNRIKDKGRLSWAEILPDNRLSFSNHLDVFCCFCSANCTPTQLLISAPPFSVLSCLEKTDDRTSRCVSWCRWANIFMWNVACLSAWQLNRALMEWSHLSIKYCSDKTCW